MPRTVSLGALAAILTLVAAGCDMSAHGGMDMSTPRNDVEFVDAMIPHHRGAIEMAGMVLARGQSGDVKAFAQRVVTAQTQEIATMNAARKALKGSENTSGTHDDPHMDADMARMRTLSGAALDREFLADMLPHHAGAIEMAHNALPNLRRADLQALARAIVADQADEIAEIRALLKALGAP